MLRIFGSPSRYLQGPGALARLGETVSSYGSRVLLVADTVVLARYGERFEAALERAGLKTRVAAFSGECTAAAVGALTDEAMAFEAGVVVAAGGGKAIDAAKGACIATGAKIVVVPTVASNDSPTSRLSVIYDEDHVLREVRRLPANPDAIVVDTSIIVAAPERFFVAGIGDAISKKFEGAQNMGAGGDNFYGAKPSFLSIQLADACFDTLMRHGEGALAALRRGVPDEAFERTVEATILLSGLAFENAGLSIAHSLTRGLSAIPALHGALHGEEVAYGLLVQLFMEGRDRAFIQEIASFYRRVGLPLSLRGMGCEADPAAVAPTIAKVTWERAPYVRNLVAPVDEARLARAVLAVEALSARR
ncbi:MAG: glycerol dehydrogenase [Betaproteobacteria bacterium]|jgi:glycerol dehydrogenase|nr:glycerol dehydrogenase [Rhodocyclaceae bacterium]MCA3140974.1 glycerol dehydrogenase [Rhodocyclaceae bacterium]